MERWVEETLHRGFRVRLKADNVLFDSETEHQRLIILENADFGRVMMLDGIVQVTTKDEFVYHEMMSHVPLFAHGKARRALIVGGGDGGVLREVLKHPEIEQATLCEIDQGVIDLCRQHFPEVSAGAYDDKRTRIVIADGTKFVAETPDRFDVIMIDSTDPVGPGAVLFTREFYAGCARCLKPGGLLVTQNGLPFLQASELQAERRLLPRAVRRRFRLSRQHAELFRRPDVLWLGHRQCQAPAPQAAEDRAPLRVGRRFPHALLDARRACRRLRAADLCARSWSRASSAAGAASADPPAAAGNRRRTPRSRRYFRR